MERISADEFSDRFPAPEPDVALTDVVAKHVTLDRPTIVSGVLKDGLTVPGGLTAMVSGIVNGNLVVARDAVVYLDGVVNGDLHVDGAVCVTGTVKGRLRAAETAVVAVDGPVSDTSFA
ncbi:MAG TPA: polymer-forming cytoskeletal protein [Candidatus Cybelea sp.]|jgi:hypothetical protein